MRDDAGVHEDVAFAAHRRRVIVVTFAMIILVDFAAFFLDAPQTSILESIICDRYYGTDGIDSITGVGDASRDCTAGPVQAELATINQMLNTFNRLPGLFVAIPMGLAADRFGRRPVLFLTFFGALLQDLIAKIILWHPGIFAPRSIWLSSLAMFVGGSDAVSTAIVFLVVADVASPQQRAKLFFSMTACERIGEIVGTPLSTLLMYTYGPWVPYILSTILTQIAFVGIIFFMPETLRAKPAVVEPNSSEENEGVTEREAVLGNTAKSTHTSLKLHSLIAKFQPLLRRNVVAVIVAFFVSALGRQSTSFFLQYIHQRFNWTYEKVRGALGLK
ncbi:hypothetical protein SEUCBS140593_004573 [Sporothrix eucalyptigena]|uniref:Major facilitator superfamily (MFS) profile domain-containing protein n=1 Tax=Sporothrix eucalyptigena TaxID=1812306 RepID=A0ABP0BP68_9PEZI